jgi:hypothetical protein
MIEYVFSTTLLRADGGSVAPPLADVADNANAADDKTDAAGGGTDNASEVRLRSGSSGVARLDAGPAGNLSGAPSWEARA